ncbi:MAG: hypothetical protein HZA51_18220 [Planctomycetes bacterium]|nr:hypothetical protein [Planctomycetota bacterium]
MNFFADHRDTASTVAKTLSPEQLDQLDGAILSRNPPTYSACYAQFALEDLGISFDAFYRYARRLRTSLRAAAFAQNGVPDPDTSETILPRLVCQRMVETLLTEKLSPRALVRLADAYRMTSQVEIHRRRLDMTEEMNIHRIAAATHEAPRLPAPKSDPALPPAASHDSHATSTDQF